ncbi:PAS domain-containing protein [bacterium]|nr:PAS domain-containing protein [bacterium]
MYDSSNFGGIALYYKDHIIESNEQFSNIFDYEPEEIIGKDIRELLKSHK